MQIVENFVLSQNVLRFLFSLGIIVGVVLVTALMRKIVRRFGERRRYTPNRIFQVIVLINTTGILVVFVLLSALWGFTGHGFMVFASSIFALAGIAFFAAWSILSNITAALVLFFHAPFGVMDRVRILDGDNTVTGRVRQMGLFFLILEDENGHRFSIPNNVLMQRTVLRLAPNKEIPQDQKHANPPK